MAFKNFNSLDFWVPSEYASEKYIGDYPTDEMIEFVEKELGYKLPDSYIELMRLQNGGIPFNCCYPTKEENSWAEDHIAIKGIMGIGHEKPYSLCGEFGSKFWIGHWGYPDSGIYICDCPSGGHDMVMLDYTKCGKEGEPEVVHVGQEDDYKKTFLAVNFETFIKGLVDVEVFELTEEDLEADLEKIRDGQFSTTLSQMFKANESIDFDTVLRNLLTELTRERGYFVLYADEFSYLAYDIQFYLYSNNHEVLSIDEYLKEYPKMIALGDNKIRVGGYAKHFVSNWIHRRISNQEIVKTVKGYAFSPEYGRDLLNRLKKYE